MLYDGPIPAGAAGAVGVLGPHRRCHRQRLFLLEGYLGTRLDRSISFVSELAARGEPAAVFFRLSDLVAGILLGVGGLLAYTCFRAMRPCEQE